MKGANADMILERFHTSGREWHVSPNQNAKQISQIDLVKSNGILGYFIIDVVDEPNST